MFKIKSQHEHEEFDCHPRRQIDNQLETVQIIPLQEQKVKPKKRKIRINSIPGDDPNQYMMADALIPQLEQSIDLLPEIQFQAISVRRKNLQNFVYITLVEDGKYYLNQLFKTQKISHLNEIISDTVAEINDGIIGEILSGEHDVHKIARPTKEQIFNGGTRITGAAIKIRQEMLKAKLSDLKADINVSNMNISESNPSSFLNLNSADLYAQSSYRTKQAKQFVKRMQQHQQSQRRERELKQQYKRQKKLEQQSQKRQMEERIKQQKHEYLVKQFQQKKEAKQQQRKQQQAKTKEFKKFLEQYKGKVPLFVQKQKQFHEKVEIPENRKKFDILKEIKEQRRPLDHQQLKEHERNYLQIRQDYIYEKNAARALEQKARAKKPDKQLPKSKFHALIQKQQKQKKEVVDELELKTKMYDRRLEYSNEIKTKFIPKIDFKKRQELIKKSEELNWVQKVRINKSMHMDTYKKDGKDNLDKLHKYIAQLKAKGKILTSTARTIQSSPQKNSARYKNYLHQLRDSQTSLNMRPSRTHSIDYTTLLSNREQAEKIKINLKLKQESTSRREQYIANLGSRNLQKYMLQKKKLDDDYLETVKAKMAIINKFQ